MGFKCAAGEKVQENHPDYCKMIRNRPQFVSESEPRAQQEMKNTVRHISKTAHQAVLCYFFLGGGIVQRIRPPMPQTRLDPNELGHLQKLKGRFRRINGRG